MEEAVIFTNRNTFIWQYIDLILFFMITTKAFAICLEPTARVGGRIMPCE